MVTMSRASAAVTPSAEGGVSTGVDSGPIRVDRRLLFVLFFVLVAAAVMNQAGDAHLDFGIFYYAAHMVLDGSRHALYDLPAQQAFQAQFHRPAGMYFCHPPVTLLPFLAIAKLPAEAAFILWTVASLALLVFSVRTLAQYAGLQYGNWPLLLSLAFMPVTQCLQNGQLALVILSAYVVTYSLWRKERFFLGGVVLSIATLKFQFVLGFVAVLLLKRKWRELLGFSSGSVVLIAISAFITGLPGLLRYPVFLLHGGASYSEAELEQMAKEQMANWRGLLSLVHADHAVFVAALSLLTVVLAALLWRDLDTGFSAAIIAAMLVSYHFNLNDVSLFLIPVFLSVNIGLRKKCLPRLALATLLIPAVVAAFGGYFAILAIPLALCLWWMLQRCIEKRTEIVTAAAIQ